MVRFAKIKRMISDILAEVVGLGGATQNRMISVKGVYSKPRGENSLVIPLSRGNNQDVVFVLQKEVELDDGDVYLTDDKNHIHFRYSRDHIYILGDTIFADNVTIEKDLHVKGKITCETNIEADGIIRAGVDVEGGSISLTGHTHTQTDSRETSSAN